MKPLLCVVDLEATCWPDHKAPGPDGQGWIEPRTEIIEIGAVMVDLPGLAPLGEFDMFVRPKLNPALTDFCKTLTSIRQENVDAASPFPAVIEKFEAWIVTFGKREDVLFGSWSLYDKNQLKLDCELHAAAFPFDDEHLNIKNHVATRMGRKPRGVARTLALLDMTFDGTPHRGIDDVRNILNIMRKVGLGELPVTVAAGSGPKEVKNEA